MAGGGGGGGGVGGPCSLGMADSSNHGPMRLAPLYDTIPHSTTGNTSMRIWIQKETAAYCLKTAICIINEGPSLIADGTGDLELVSTSSFDWHRGIQGSQWWVGGKFKLIACSAELNSNFVYFQEYH